jgi:GNAT superfamily N-acetyltransferase
MSEVTPSDAAPLELALIDVTNRDGQVVAPVWLARAEAVHRQLRPQLPTDYATALLRVFAGGGRLVVASAGDRVVGLAVWRAHENTCFGPHVYVDDLVTDAAVRSRGVGKALLGHCTAIARSTGCRVLTLESGVQRARAHQFYFREGLVIEAFSFGKRL